MAHLAAIAAVHVVVLLAAWRLVPVRPPAPPVTVPVALLVPTAKPWTPPRLKPAPPKIQPPQRIPEHRLASLPVPAPVVAVVPLRAAPMPHFQPPRQVVLASSPAAITLPAPAPHDAPATPEPKTNRALIAPRFDAAYLDNPAPHYPALSRRRGEEGRVLLHVEVGADGRARAVEVRTSSGSARLDAAAVDAVRRWTFVPARRGDQAVGASVLVPIVFSLDA